MRNFSSLSRFTFVFALLGLFILQAKATVDITQPIGGQNISIDKAVGGTAAGFTVLGNIVIADNSATDFTSGTNVTFVLTRPTGWQFRAGVGTVIRTGANITAASITVTATAITVKYTASGTQVTGNSLTIANIEVQPTTNGVGTPVNITRTSGTGVIAGFENLTPVASLSKAPGVFTKLQTLLPGQSAVPGSATGKTGTPTPQNVDVAFNVIVNAVDAGWNIVTTAPSDDIQITSSDANAVLPANNTLVAGTQTFSMEFKASGSRTVTATNATDGTKTANASTAVAVAGGAFVKLQILMPGETAAPGTATGKTGTPTTAMVGVNYTVTVNAVDANWNKVTSTNLINISAIGATNATIPANAALVAGTKNFNVNFKLAGETPTITATNVTAPSITSDTSPTFAVAVGAFSKLQILLPGETASPGSATGKIINSPTSAVAGTSTTVTVNAVDAGWNKITSVTDVVRISSSDANADLPANAALVAGTQTFDITLKSSGNKTITANDFTDGTKTVGTSANVAVTADAYVKLLIVLPGETLAPGSATGKTGTPSVRSAGTSFVAAVYAVDAYNNRVSSATDVINMVTDDPLGANPANAALSAGGRNFNVILRTIGTTYTVTATDVTDGSKTLYTTVAIPVGAGPVNKLQVLLPGETAMPGTATGKTGTPTAQAAGSSFMITVNAVDAAWNVVTTVTDVVRITSPTYTTTTVLPADAALVAGTGTFAVTLNRAIAQTIKASDITVPAITANTSASVAVNPGAFAKLQVLLPGETTAPGTATGKTGTPTAQSSGIAFNATVNAVDANWNKVTSITDVVNIASGDVADVMPVNAALVAGTKTSFSVILRTLGSRTITASDVTDITKTADVSSAVTINPGAFAKLQILLPGETAAPGTASGKTGTPSTRTAGSSFAVTVNAVDAAWNIVSTATDVVRITSTDLNSVLPADAALVAGTQTFNIALKTAISTKTITATDITNGAKLPNTSPVVPVIAGPYAQLLVLLPGETAAPGTATGIINNPNIPARNTAFNIKIISVDAFYNMVTGITNSLNLSTSDATATVPASSSLATGGTRSLGVTLRTAGSQTISITDGSTAFNTVVTISDPTVASVIGDHFRSVDSGIWTDAATWESSADGISGWHAATLTPTSASATITIRNTHEVTISANLAVDQVTVETGGKVLLTGGTLTIANGTGDDFIVAGTLTSASTITTTGTLVFNANGTYQHNFAGVTGTIPIAIWNTGSVCEVIGYTSYAGAITGSGQTFSDFIWNCPNQNIAAGGPSLAGTFGARDFTVIATGNGNVYLGASGGTATISRNFSQSGGNIVLNKTSGTETLNVAGNFALSGGTLQKGTSTASNVVFNGSTAQAYSKSGSTISGAVNFAINSGATVDFGTSVIDGTSGTFTLTTGGTIITANDDGLAAAGTNTGSIQNTGTRTYNAANFTYNGSNDQLAGTGLPLAIANLTINNSQGVTMPLTSATYSISGVLSIGPSGGFLDMKTNVLSGTFTNTGVGTLKTQASSGLATGKTWTVGVEFNSSSSQNIISGTYNKLLATSGSGTKLGPTGILNVAGDWSSTDGEVDLISNSTPIAFNGSSAQSIADLGSNGGDGLLFRNVTFSGGGSKTLTNGNFSISTTGVLNMGVSTILNAGGNLTLLSNSSSSGSVAAIPSSASIRGSVKVERFVNGGAQNPYRTYRMLSSPVYDNTASFINSNSPGNRTYGFSQFIDDMIISGSLGATNGFDETPANLAGAYTYNDGYIEVPNINTSVNVGRGTYIFYRGNRADFTGKTVSPFVDPESTIVDFDGILNQQSITVPLTYSAGVNGFNLVGNPYAATLDWNSGSWTKSNMGNVIRIWDPSLRQYATYDGATGVNGGSQYIPAGQSFFVQASNSSGSLTFAEAVKANTQPGVLLLSTPSTGEVLDTAIPTELRVRLRKSQAFNQDETVVVLKSGKTAEFVDGEDVTHLNGEEVFLSSLSTDNKKLVINYMPEIENVSAVKLNVNATSSGDYYLEFNLSNVPAAYTVQLKDSFLNTITNITDGSGYLLGIDKAETASFGADRFSILINAPVTLPVQLTGPSATKVPEGVVVKWTTSSEVNNNRFEIERAGDNGVFVAIGELLAKGSGSYTFLDRTPLIGNNYYRLKQIDNDGKYAFFGPAAIKYDLSSVSTSALSIFPNPVNDQFTVKFTGVLESAKQVIKVISPTGQILTTKTITKEELNNGYNVNVSTYPTGVYIVELLDATTQKRVGLLKMIKL